MVLAMNLAALLAAAATSSAPGRLLLCRPRPAGDAALARADAVSAAAKAFGNRFLDYGVVCDGEAEAARAARRAGLEHAVSALAEGRSDGSRYVLALSVAEGERVLARREVVVAPGADAVAPLQRSLAELVRSVEPPDGGKGPGPWLVAGGGAAALCTGLVFAALARSAAVDADRATTAQGWVDARAAWKSRRAASAVLLGAGGAAVVAGLVWRFAL
jgi:hypothetical protein